MIVKSYLTVYSAKMIADIVSDKFPVLHKLLVGTSCNTIVEKYGDDGYIPIHKFLLDNNVPLDQAMELQRAFTKRYLQMNSGDLAALYFQLEHVQKVVRSSFLRAAPNLAPILGNKITDSQWTIISAYLTKYYSNTRMVLVHKDQSRILGWYISQIPIIVQNYDLVSEGLVKTGLDTEIGDSTLTPLHNQAESISEELTRYDLTNFQSILKDIAECSEHLYHRTPHGGQKYVFYDILSNQKYKVMSQVQNKLKVSIKNAMGGATRYAPNIELNNLITLPTNSSQTTAKDLEARVNARMDSLSKFDQLLVGVSDTSMIIESMEYHHAANYAESGVKTDGKFMYNNNDLDSLVVHKSLDIILRGYGALRKLINYCSKTGYNYLTIPVTGFRRPELAKSFSTLNEYVSMIDITEKLASQELDNAISGGKSFYNEKLLMAKDALKGKTLGDVYTDDDEGKVIMQDIRFLLDFMHSGTGKYASSNYEGINKNKAIMVDFLRKDKGTMFRVWDRLKEPDVNVIQEVNGYTLTSAILTDIQSSVKSFLLIRSKDAFYYLFEESGTNWNLDVAAITNYLDIFSKILMMDARVQNNLVGDLGAMATVIQAQRVFISLSNIIHAFLYKVGAKEITGDLKITDYGYELKDSSEVMAYFLEDPKISKLVDLPITYSEKKKLLFDLGLFPEYVVGTDSDIMERLLVSALETYVELYDDVFNFIRFLYRVSTTPVLSLFNIIKFNITSVKPEVLEEFCAKLYSAPYTEASSNHSFVTISSRSKKDEYYGIFKESTGRYPLVIKDHRNRPTYLHESGYLIHMERSGILIETPIGKETQIQVEN